MNTSLPSPDAEAARRTAWISHGLEELIHGLDRDPERPQAVDFDVVIVGSGYGGAIAAAHLAGCTKKDDTGQDDKPVTVCVLERGKEYLPGMFPARLADLAAHVRYGTEGNPCPRGEREGLFDVRVGSDVSAVVANGLGGGSLINAGVVEEPAATVFARDWPGEISTALPNSRYFAEARKLLGAVVTNGGKEERNTIKLHPKGLPAKYEALRQLSCDASGRPGDFNATAITVAMTDRESSAGVALHECQRCGDCATGCNHGAKDSLDVNLLVTAARAGATIYTGATVLKIAQTQPAVPGAPHPLDDTWTLDVVHTAASLRVRQGPPLRLIARKVVLAAGTFGSTEILLRSQGEELQFSAWLGRRFSTNGDMIAVAYDQNINGPGQQGEVNAVADESVPPGKRAVGPTITGFIDLRASSKPGMVIEELAVPGPLRRLFEETVTTSHLLYGLANPDADDHDPDGPPHDPCAVRRSAVRSSSMLAVMGDDGAGGALELIGGDGENDGDGAIRVRWPEVRQQELFEDQIETLRRLGLESGTRGAVLPNPLWQLLPDDMQFLFDNKRGPLLTVHPLGGCPMGKNVDEGAVDHLGRVFDGSKAKSTLPGLVVLDGSIVPVALGINPSLTIAALALYAVEGLRRDWEYTWAGTAKPVSVRRPVFHDMPDPAKPRRTEVEFVERMSGPAALQAKGGGTIQCVVELTMKFQRLPLADLILPGDDGVVPMKRTLHVDEGDTERKSELRVFRKDAWDEWRQRAGPEAELERMAIFRAPVSGRLDLLHREASTGKERQCRALRAWFRNRGLRDVVQEVLQRLRSDEPLPKDLGGFLRRRWRELKALASHAGEVRLFEYTLAVGTPVAVGDDTSLDMGAFERSHAIAGRKRLTYGRRANPWWQLQRMTLDTFPGLAAADTMPVLELDTTYLAQERVALMRIVAHQDEPSAIADLASFAGYFIRLLLTLHVWCFRRPDPALPREPQRLPGMVYGLPAPEINELSVDVMSDGRPVRVRLTRYKRPSSREQPPVVMIHGYSASGTTFAHHAVDPNLARYFWKRKRDVWILDLRTSSGMPTARYPWAFEDAALADIPAALDFIYRETGKNKVDVFAHCMGAAMFSMALLAPPEPGDRFFRERAELPTWIRRIVLSQIGPVVVFSPANIFRAYLMSYLRHFLPLANYEFRVSPDPSLTDQLIDRFLATLPYPDEEFDIENPFWPPWRSTPFVGTRHRMDALYGRDFSLANIDGRVLEYIDDLFGPLSIDTVAQAINFARLEVVTNQAGRNEYVSRDNFLTRWVRNPPGIGDVDNGLAEVRRVGIATLSIHGAENGLADVATLTRMDTLLRKNLGLDFEKYRVEGCGHQDCLIGRDAGRVFAKVFDFLS